MAGSICDQEWLPSSHPWALVLTVTTGRIHPSKTQAAVHQVPENKVPFTLRLPFFLTEPFDAGIIFCLLKLGSWGSKKMRNVLKSSHPGIYRAMIHPQLQARVLFLMPVPHPEWISCLPEHMLRKGTSLLFKQIWFSKKSVLATPDLHYTGVSLLWWATCAEVSVHYTLRCLGLETLFILL